MIFAIDDDQLGIRQAVGDELGVLGQDDVFAAGRDQHGDVDARQIGGIDVRLRQHQRDQRIWIRFVFSGEVFHQLRIRAVGIEVGSADRHQAQRAGVSQLERQADDAAVAPAVVGGLFEAECGDELIDVFGHVGIVVFVERLIGALSARVQRVDLVACVDQLLHLDGKRGVRAAVAVHEHDRLALAGDGIAQRYAIDLDGRMFADAVCFGIGGFLGRSFLSFGRFSRFLGCSRLGSFLCGLREGGAGNDQQHCQHPCEHFLHISLFLSDKNARERPTLSAPLLDSIIARSLPHSSANLLSFTFRRRAWGTPARRHSAVMYLSMIDCTVPSAMSSSSAALNSS